MCGSELAGGINAFGIGGSNGSGDPGRSGMLHFGCVCKAAGDIPWDDAASPLLLALGPPGIGTVALATAGAAVLGKNSDAKCTCV
jgi:hypothetical protein